MEDTTCPTNVLESASAPGLMMLLVTLIVGGIVLVICYVASRRSRSRQDSSKMMYFVNKDEFAPASQLVEQLPQPPEPEYLHEYGGKRGKNKKRREAQQERTHPWMIGTLKGHTGTVNDMDFSSNGRYLASCADDARLQETRKHVQSFGQQHDKHKKKEWNNSNRSFKQGQLSVRRDGRQDRRTGGASRSKNREFCPYHEMPFSYFMLTVPSSDGYVSKRLEINLSDDELISTIKTFVLSPQYLIDCGYPIESTDYPGCVMIKNVEYPSGPSEPKIEEYPSAPSEPSAPKIEEYPSEPLESSEPKIEEYPSKSLAPVCNGSDSGAYSNTSSEVNSDQEQNLSDNEKKCPDNEESLDNKNSENENDSDNGKSYDSESSSYYETSSESSSESRSYYETSSESGSYYETSSESSLPCLSSIENTSDSESSCDSEKSSDSEKCSHHPNNTTRSDDEKTSDSESAFNSEGSNDTDESDGQLQRTCARCKKIFHVNYYGEFVNVESCVYHYGKRHNRLCGGETIWFWTCCGHLSKSSKGCAEWKTHVWSGTVPGSNGPFEGYTPTIRYPERLSNDNYGVYSLDCEMCYTLQGMELIRVTVVNLYGQVVYDSLVKPYSEIIDYNTKFSGIKAEDMVNVTKTLWQVQFDLLNFIYAETILMGHSLESDLKALRLIHKNVVDTSVLFPHWNGLPYRLSLKNLAHKLLQVDIQKSTHNSVEDARAVMDMVLRKADYECRKKKEKVNLEIVNSTKDSFA